MQKLQGIDPNISISGLLGDRSKDIGLFGGLLRKTLKKEALLERENPININNNNNNIINNNQSERIDIMGEESLNLSYAPLNEDDNRSIDSNISMTLDSTNLLNFKKNTTSKIGNFSPNRLLICLTEPLKAEGFLKLLLERQDKSQKDFLGLLCKFLGQGLDKLVSGFSSQKVTKPLEGTHQTLLDRTPIDWSLKFQPKLDHILEAKPPNICKSFSPTSFDYKSRLETSILNDKRMQSFVFITNPPNRNPFEYLPNKNIIAIAENDHFSFFDKQGFFSGVFEPWCPFSIHKPSLKPSQYLYQYESGDNNSQQGYTNESLAPVKAIFKSPSLGYPIISLLYAGNESSANQLILAVVGLNTLNVVYLDKSFNLIKKLPFENKTPQDYIVKVLFVPNAENYLAVLTLRSLKILSLQAENHPITIVRFTLLDQTLFKDFTFMENPGNPKEKRLFVASNDGNLYTHPLNLDDLQGLNEEELILVENVYFSPESKANGKSISSVSYFPQSQLLFCSIDDGNTIAGKFSEKDLEIINVIKIKATETFNNKEKAEPFLQKQGQILTQIKEINVDEEQAKYIGVLRKVNNFFGVLLKLSNSSIIYQPLLPPNSSNTIKSEGLCLVPYLEKSLIMILEAFEDGSLHIFLHPIDDNLDLKGLRALSEEKPLIGLKKKEKGIDQKEPILKEEEIEAFVQENYSVESIGNLINCKVFVDFPERFQNITTKFEQNAISLSDEFQSLLPVNLRNFKAISNMSKDSPFILKPDKQNILMGLGLMTKEWVICGLRLKLGLNERNPDLRARVFEREYQLPLDKNKEYDNNPIILDIPFSEPEIIFIYLQGQIEIEFYSTQGNNKPLMVLFFAIEIFGCPQSDFNMKGKINVLGQILKLNSKETEIGNKLFNEKTFKSIQSSLLNTKILPNSLDMHLKGDFLRNEIKIPSHVKLIHLVDILSLFLIWFRNSKAPKTAHQIDFLLDPLRKLLLEEKLDKYLKSSIKRLIRSILSYQEKGLDYEGFKDMARIELVDREFCQPGLTCEKALSLYQLLAKIWGKRLGNIMLLFHKNPLFQKKALEFFLSMIRTKNKDLEESVLENLASRTFKLMLLYYQYLRNQALFQEKRKEEINKEVLEDKSAYLEVFFRQLFELFEQGDFEQRARLMRVFVDTLKVEILNYSEEALNNPILMNLPKDLFEIVNTNIIMEIEKTEENEEDIMNLAIEMSLKDPASVLLHQEKEKERVQFEIYTFEIFSDLFEWILRKLSSLSKGSFEEYAGSFFYLLYQTVNLPISFLINKLISPVFSAFLDKALTCLYETIFTGLMSLTDQRSLLCFINLVNNFIKYLNKSASPSSPEEKPLKSTIRVDTPVKRKRSSFFAIEQNPVKGDCRRKFLTILKNLEGSSMNFSDLVLKTLESFHYQFINNNGSIRYEYTQGVFNENFKRYPNEQSSRFINDKAFADAWRAVFKRGDLLKKGNGVFMTLDQGLYSSLVTLMMNMVSLGYRDYNEAGWTDLICRSLVRPPTYSLAINGVKRLRNKICKEQEIYNANFDKVIYQVKLEFLKKIYESSNKFKKPLTYEQMQFLLRTLNTLSRHSSKRPQSWSDFNSTSQELLAILIETFPLNINEITENCLHLLAAYFTPLQLEEKASKLLSKGSKDYEELINKIIENGLGIQCKPWFLEISAAFDYVTSQIFLESNSKVLRMNCLKFLIALWFAGNTVQKAIILNKMLEIAKGLMSYGNNVEHYLLFINFMGCFLKNEKGEETQRLKELISNLHWELINSFVKLKEGLKSHRNFEIYRELNELLYDLNESRMKARKLHYYFEMNGCLKCYELMNSPYHEMKLNEITDTKYNNQLPLNPLVPNYQEFKYESFKYSEKKLKFNENVKFTGNSIIAKLNNTYEIDSITLIILENYKIKKTIKSISISINNRIINDILDLKNLKSEWKFAKSQTLDDKVTSSGSRKTLKIPFTIPLMARNLKIEFFMSQQKGESMFGNCEVCGSVLLEDKYLGTFCMTCKERNREKQCPCCYNIIYEKNDSIFCVPDCGYCKFFEYEIVVSSRIGSKIEKIDSTKARDDVNNILGLLGFGIGFLGLGL